jgi:hypothetical protein
MKINGIEFEFSPQNAAHLERMETAFETYQAENERDKALADGTVRGGIAFLRADNASIARFLNAVLGEGAAAQLGADPDDHEASLAALNLVCDAIKATCGGSPNRQTRRAKAKGKQ